MEIKQIRNLRGPNLWGRCAALEVELEQSSQNESIDVDAWARLGQWMPQIPSHLTGPALLQQVAIELQRMAGAKLEITPGDLPPVASDGRRVAVPYDEETVGRECVSAAMRLIDAAN